MKYILDFDGVIFNTQVLKDAMASLGIDESLRTKDTFDEIKRSMPDFDASSLVFSDARLFLEKNAEHCEVVSSFLRHGSDISVQAEDVQRTFQENKIQRAGIVDLLGKEHIHVVGKSKKEMLLALKTRFDGEGSICIFIDDRQEYIAEAESIGIRTFWMRREVSTVGKGEITSFTDLENIL
jgi:hypothetical protein